MGQLTRREVAQILGRSISRVRQLESAGTLHPVQREGRWLHDRAEVENLALRYMRGMSEETAQCKTGVQDVLPAPEQLCMGWNTPVVEPHVPTEEPLAAPCAPPPGGAATAIGDVQPAVTRSPTDVQVPPETVQPAAASSSSGAAAVSMPVQPPSPAVQPARAQPDPVQAPASSRRAETVQEQICREVQVALILSELHQGLDAARWEPTAIVQAMARAATVLVQLDPLILFGPLLPRWMAHDAAWRPYGVRVEVPEVIDTWIDQAGNAWTRQRSIQPGD